MAAACSLCEPSGVREPGEAGLPAQGLMFTCERVSGAVPVSGYSLPRESAQGLIFMPLFSFENHSPCEEGFEGNEHLQDVILFLFFWNSCISNIFTLYLFSGGYMLRYVNVLSAKEAFPFSHDSAAQPP